MPHLSCWPTVSTMMSAHGSLYFWCVTSTMSAMATHPHTQSHTMDGIAIGRSPTSNALLVYNPQSMTYYEPDSYPLDPYCLPLSVYPQLKYDGGLFCSLVRDSNTPMEEPYPPCNCIEHLDPDTKQLLAGTVMDIPLSSGPTGSPAYHILFDNGLVAMIPLTDMLSLILPPLISP